MNDVDVNHWIHPLPKPLYQLGGYEFDLLKFYYFGWLNLATISYQALLRNGDEKKL